MSDTAASVEVSAARRKGGYESGDGPLPESLPTGPAPGAQIASVGPMATGANEPRAAYVWLVISTNGRVMSVLDNEAAAKHVAGDHWIVERWAVRHLVEVEDGSWLPL